MYRPSRQDKRILFFGRTAATIRSRQSQCAASRRSIFLRNPLAHKRIVPSLVADSGGGAVAGIDDTMRRQRPELGADAAKEELAVAAGEVETAHTLAKKNVAAEHDQRGLATEIDDVARRMARNIQH